MCRAPGKPALTEGFAGVRGRRGCGSRSQPDAASGRGREGSGETSPGRCGGSLRPERAGSRRVCVPAAERRGRSPSPRHTARAKQRSPKGLRKEKARCANEGPASAPGEAPTKEEITPRCQSRPETGDGRHRWAVKRERLADCAAGRRKRSLPRRLRGSPEARAGPPEGRRRQGAAGEPAILRATGPRRAVAGA